MRLWTFQTKDSWKTLKRDGVLHKPSLCNGVTTCVTCNWMADQLTLRVGPSPNGIAHPIWAWYQLRAKHGPNPQMRSESSIYDAERLVLLEIDIPDSAVLRSMWVFTKHGFMSAVQTSNDDQKIMVRSRDKTHLDSLIREYDLMADSAEPVQVIESPDSDYRFRIILSRNDWANLITVLACDVDYPNFKNEVYRLQGQSAYEHALHKIWEIMYRTQSPQKNGQMVQTANDNYNQTTE